MFTLDNVDYKNIVRYSDVQISEGGVVFVCGKSGSGKSTLLRLLNGTISPTSGVVTYKGRDVNAILDDDTAAYRREVLLVRQSPYLFADKTIVQNFGAFHAYLDRPYPNESTVNDCLSLCCADDLSMTNECGVLSGGERQRVFLAVNLSLGAKVLLLDEPTSALDTQTAVQVMTNIKAHCRDNGMTLIVVSHDSAITEIFADRVVTL
ncbi:MAG: ATP-binding cassette domain-containing protein [Oscillospiraceae bacterium]|nr:ATP-binding cassette domain-containing protein [Oscillospiraceae bacterium]